MNKFTFIKSQCTGCGACVVACMDINNPDIGGEKAYRTLKSKETEDRIEFIIQSCLHCEKPACIASCPFDAIYKRRDGYVIIDEALCVKCGKCIHGCPFGSITRKAGQYPQKCYGCPNPEAPVCVDACPQKAIKFNY